MAVGAAQAPAVPPAVGAHNCAGDAAVIWRWFRRRTWRCGSAAMVGFRDGGPQSVAAAKAGAISLIVGGPNRTVQ